MSKEFDLFLKNEVRKEKLMKELENIPPVLIRVKEEWDGWWFKKDKQYMVKKYLYKATKDGTNTYCHCHDCQTERKRKELYDMYEVIDPKYHGNILPMIVCEEIIDQLTIVKKMNKILEQFNKKIKQKSQLKIGTNIL